MAARKSRLAPDVLTILRNKGHLKNIPSQGGMMEALLLAIIAQGASVAAAQKALSRVKESVVNWNELRVTQPPEVARMLVGIKDADAKAGAIHDVLTSIFEGTHDLELRFLDNASGEEAKDFLRGIAALNVEIVNMVILAGRGHFTMVPDSDVLRVVKRLGIAGRVSSAGKCTKALDDILGEEKAYQMMFLLKELSEHTCISHSPRCPECPLAAKCPSARKSKAR